MCDVLFEWLPVGFEYLCFLLWGGVFMEGGPVVLHELAEHLFEVGVDDYFLELGDDLVE